jgi:hypothetical protein
MNGPLGGGNPGQGRLCVRVDCLNPSPPSYHMTGVWREPTSLSTLVVMVGLFKPSPEYCYVSTQNHMDLWSVWLVLTHHHHLHRHQLPFHRTTLERVSWLLGSPSVYYPVRFLGCLELFSNSHLSVLSECSLWVKPPFNQTSLPPGYHKNHLIWVDSSLIIPWASLRLLASDNKNQPPPPDHLQNLLIWVDSTKMIPLGFAQYVPWVHSRTPQLNPNFSCFIFLFNCPTGYICTTCSL